VAVAAHQRDHGHPKLAGILLVPQDSCSSWVQDVGYISCGIKTESQILKVINLNPKP